MAAHDAHHYVPAFLLRQWEGGADAKLSAFHWANGKLVNGRYKAKSVAKELGLYSLQVEKGQRDNIVEREFFARAIDDPAAVVHRRLTTAGLRALSRDERFVWGRFIVAQMFRGPRHLRSLKAKGAEALQASLDTDPEEYTKLKDDVDPATLSEWLALNAPITTGDNFALAALPSLVDSELLNDVMRKAAWGTYRLKDSSHAFVIGDHPLIYVGTMNTSFLLALPTSPTTVFVAFNRETTAHRIAQLKEPEIVRDINVATVQSAEQYVYGTSAEQAPFIAAHLHQA